MSAMKKPVQDIPEDEEIDEMDEDEEGQDEFEMDEDGIDLVEALGQMLCTEEGETVATSLASIATSAEKIAAQLEMHNKILVKIFGALKPPVPTGTVAPA
jgi:hypothetical protein